MRGPGLLHQQGQNLNTKNVTYRFSPTLSLLCLRWILGQGFHLGIRRRHGRTDRTVRHGFRLGHDGVHDRVILIGMGCLDHRDHWMSPGARKFLLNGNHVFTSAVLRNTDHRVIRFSLPPNHGLFGIRGNKISVY